MRLGRIPGGKGWIKGVVSLTLTPGCRKFVKDYVSSCYVCAKGKDSYQKPSGLLQPLPVSSRPWDSISWDFITNLPPTSNDNDTILTIVDRFVKNHSLGF
jgi:hypothetical protein